MESRDVSTAPDLPDAAGGPDDAPLVQLVTPAGSRVTTPEAEAYRERVAHLDPAALRGLYRDMVLTRRFDDEATSLQRQGELGLFAQAKGQEAAQVGSARALATQDYVFPSYREHGVSHVRGIDPTARLRMYRGVDHGGWDPAEHNVHLYTLVIGSHVLHATGYAMGVQRDGLVGTGDPERDTAVVAYFGDGATSQGDVSEALVFAAVNNAPVVFFCQNNQWAISEPATKQARVPLYRRGSGFGVPSVRVDGNDVLACYAVMAEALERARTGGGPTFVEAFTYRMGAHTTSDDPTRYRSRAQEEYWRRRDPIDRLEALLRAEGTWDEAFAAEVAAEGEALGERLRTEVRALEAPPASTMFEHVYASPHAVVDADRSWFAEYEQSFEPADHVEGSTR
ncbi:pyruvate dehydrogenase (acetyl-transferring) E1 component subunit alpha [Cellulosimicrobium arenosum]|uniref:Pyruvate dehydrogenase (Acetyl-transferring) E1 component subunit alpha n=1 Tax=Cellulosimicrobium arenosum TaxID=2708133 RepID=A0A927J1S7_9MICO|nr:pyruvate dehydrogenase (acetyl-transferring) E1 component subunit alpha [Cellulosimicrobium arenosum]MBD8080349.1 pyruvate dehydrogenase (acetyl-transferring) E1 component subunit alpha [Cellulosimicrobium arenosum]